MTEGQTFQRGYRVTILSRLPPDEEVVLGGRWQNTKVGKEAIIEYSNIERPDPFNAHGCYESKVCYSILILLENDEIHSMRWFEEKFLELICCNEVKGEKILKENNTP